MMLVQPSAHPSLTPPGLMFDEARHRYTFEGREQVPVTDALRLAGLVDTFWYKADDAARGSRVAAAIQLHHQGRLREAHLDAEIDPYVRAYLLFLADSCFRVDANEERLCDPRLHCAGTVDLRGHFVDARCPPNLHKEWVDIIDVKTGTAPPWVGYQTAGYARLLPSPLWRLTRRWVLELRDNGRYTLNALTKRSDEQVFLAAVTIAQAHRGWL